MPNNNIINFPQRLPLKDPIPVDTLDQPFYNRWHLMSTAKETLDEDDYIEFLEGIISPFYYNQADDETKAMIKNFYLLSP